MKPVESSFEALPNPSRQVLACGVFQAVNFVEIVMIEPLPERLECLGDFGVVNEPSCLRINLSAHADLAAKRMAVQPRALVAFRHAGQTVRRLKGEFFNKLDYHRAKS